MARPTAETTMAPEVKSKAKRTSGQTMRLRKKRWFPSGIKADSKYVGESYLYS